MRSLIVFTTCACLMTVCLVTSTPVYPTIPLAHYSPVDICLFICNICFDNMGPEMMNCANHVCLARHQFEMNLGLLRIGRTCKNFNKLDTLVLGNDTE